MTKGNHTMWKYEHTVETSAAPERIWALYADVNGWDAWDTSIEKIELHGPFEVGTEISMTPTGQDGVRFTIIELKENELFADETDLGDVKLHFIHTLLRIDGGTRVTHRVEITGPAAEQVGPHLGPAITSDLPDAMEALVKLAES
ncbi:SRPBCC family protein [Streptosporangium sp. NPDC000396]|uniref:SRPBCC family protein n=1 Tax=Streptosporangium sp. NPDC000396 TaxID=3366185 RepID=UPI00367E95C0